MNTALTSQTPPTQPIGSLLPDTQGTIIGWWVGNVTSGDSSGGNKGGSETEGKERERGSKGVVLTVPLCTLADPFLPRTGQEISRTKASCHLLLTDSL